MLLGIIKTAFLVLPWNLNWLNVRSLQLIYMT